MQKTFFIILTILKSLSCFDKLIFLDDNKAGPTGEEACWPLAYGRIGAVPTACPSGTEQDGDRCLKKCQAPNFTVWEDKCTHVCPGGFRNDGLHCAKPDPIWRNNYSLLDWNLCIAHNPQGCEQYGAFYYGKCTSGWAIGCCLCTPGCPNGMTDVGVSCEKKFYDRQSFSITCIPGQVMENGQCYWPCDTEFTSDGPLCIQKCPSGYIKCGVTCLKNDKACTDDIRRLYIDRLPGLVKYIQGDKYDGSTLDLANFISYKLNKVCEEI
jgi:hypothetical protein